MPAQNPVRCVRRHVSYMGYYDEDADVLARRAYRTLEDEEPLARNVEVSLREGISIGGAAPSPVIARIDYEVPSIAPEWTPGGRPREDMPASWLHELKRVLYERSEMIRNRGIRR